MMPYFEIMSGLTLALHLLFSFPVIAAAQHIEIMPFDELCTVDTQNKWISYTAPRTVLIHLANRHNKLETYNIINLIIIP